MPSIIMRLMALQPPPPTPITLIRAKASTDLFSSMFTSKDTYQLLMRKTFCAKRKSEGATKRVRQGRGHCCHTDKSSLREQAFEQVFDNVPILPISFLRFALFARTIDHAD